MNERIQEIIDKSPQREDDNGVWRIDVKEFAKLIARECIDLIDYHMSSYCISDSVYEEGVYEGMAHSIRLIENKFGIE